MSAAPNWAFFLETGVFVPFDEQAAASAIGRVTTQPRFGLLTRSYPTDDSGAGDQQDWTRFAKYVNQLNVDSPSHVQYKVLYLTRHGFGFHNKMEKQVGTAEWDVRNSLLFRLCSSIKHMLTSRSDIGLFSTRPTVRFSSTPRSPTRESNRPRISASSG